MLLWRFWTTLANYIHNLPHDILSHFLTPLKKAGSRQVWCFFAPRYAKCVISLIFYVMSMRRVTWLVPAVLCDCQVCTCRRLIAISNMLSVVSGKNTYIYIYIYMYMGTMLLDQKDEADMFSKRVEGRGWPATFLQLLSRTSKRCCHRDVSRRASFLICAQSYACLIEVRRQSWPEKVCMRSETSIYHIWMAPPTLGGGGVVVTHRLKGLLQLALVAQLGGCSRLLQ